VGMFAQNVEGHDWEEFWVFRYIDIDLRLIQYNAGYKIQCPLVKKCDPTLFGSRDFFQHLRSVRKKDKRSALLKLDQILKKLEERYLDEVE